MSLTIDTTLSGYHSNSYVDTTYCDAYWTDHYSPTKAAQWAALSTAQKTTLLISACRVIETARYTIRVPISEYSLHYDHLSGKILDIALSRQAIRWAYYQNLQFPRNLDFAPDTGLLYIPEAVMLAQCEQAIYTLNFDESAMSARLQGIEYDTVSIGRGQLHTAQKYAIGGTQFSPVALDLLRPYFIGGMKTRRG